MSEEYHRKILSMLRHIHEDIEKIKAKTQTDEYTPIDEEITSIQEKI